MEINWTIVAGIVILAAALVLFIIRRNQVDQKELERNLNDRDNLFNDEESELNNEK